MVNIETMQCWEFDLKEMEAEARSVGKIDVAERLKGVIAYVECEINELSGVLYDREQARLASGPTASERDAHTARQLREGGID